jgi:hypothetical protein
MVKAFSERRESSRLLYYCLFQGKLYGKKSEDENKRKGQLKS